MVRRKKREKAFQVIAEAMLKKRNTRFFFSRRKKGASAEPGLGRGKKGKRRRKKPSLSD